MNDLREVLAIKEKLALLKEKDRDFRVFGSSTHRYELFAPVPEQRIERFENDNRIKLPADYNFFLTQIGDGGAGPDYGIIPFEKAFADTQPDKFFQWSNESEVVFSEETEQSALEWEEWEENRSGTARISEHGCGIYTFLVVNGRSYGEMWVDCFGSMKPLEISFIEDYKNWLERNIARLDKIPLLKSVKTGMSKTELIEIFGNDWREMRDENGEQTIRITYENVPAAFVLNENVLVRIDDYSKMLV